MKKTSISILISILLCVVPALAEKTSKQTLEEITAKIKTSGSPTPIIEYVDWNHFYGTLPEYVKKELNISSAKALKEDFSQIFRDPGAYAVKVVERKLSDFPEEQRENIRQSAKEMRKQLNDKKEEMGTKLRETDFKVGKVEESANTSKLELISTRNGSSTTDSIQMKKIADKWYLTSPNVGQQNAMGTAPTSGSAPHGDNSF